MSNIIEEGSLTEHYITSTVQYSIDNMKAEDVWGLLSDSASIVAL